MLTLFDTALLAAGLNWAPLYEDYGIALAAIGIVVVFVALLLVASFIAVLPRVLRILTTLHGILKPATAESAAVAPPRDDEMSEETLVVIAAAVAAIMDKPHRIVKIRGTTSADQGWSLGGRMQHHQSHRIKHRDR